MLSRQYRRRTRRTGTMQRLPSVRPRVYGGSARQTGVLRRVRRTAAVFLLLTALLLLVADIALRPNIAEALRVQGSAAASRILAEETLNILESMDLNYEQLANVTRDEQGKITSIETNTAKLNLIKSRLERDVTAAVNTQGILERGVPLGTLLGSEYLSGRGPLISVRCEPLGALQTEFESCFQAAGINQTSHRIVLKLTLRLTTIVPMHRAETVVSTNFVLADTVIVGEVPDYYTNISSGHLPGGLTDGVPDVLDVAPPETENQ